jgi:hypothetical protein
VSQDMATMMLMNFNACVVNRACAWFSMHLTGIEHSVEALFNSLCSANNVSAEPDVSNLSPCSRCRCLLSILSSQSLHQLTAWLHLRMKWPACCTMKRLHPSSPILSGS